MMGTGGRIVAQLLTGAPPDFGMPSFTAGWTGWLVGIVILIAPSVWLALWAHRRLGHWQRYFAHWRRRSWLAVVGGSLVTAVAAIGLFGALPAWNRSWEAWDAQAPPDNVTTQWLDMTHAQFALLLEACCAVLGAGGIALLLLGMIFFTRHVLARRPLPQPSKIWLLPPGDR
jgi:hypothetical protein